ncbi:MAG: aa3-type cytochrome c oxidase subunit IV [Hyphomonadaceae bacterium]
MAQGAHEEYVHGEMDIADQRDTFSGFLSATVWGCTLVAQSVALLTLAFALGLGWWAGLGAFIAIAIAAGIIFKMGGFYWALQIAMIVLMAIGGAIIPAIAGLTG